MLGRVQQYRVLQLYGTLCMTNLPLFSIFLFITMPGANSYAGGRHHHKWEGDNVPRVVLKENEYEGINAGVDSLDFADNVDAMKRSILHRKSH